MIDNTAARIIRKLLSPIAGKSRYQDFFESLQRVSLAAMNIGDGSNPENSGEKNALEYVRARMRPSGPSGKAVIFDVGANVGDYAILLEKTFGDQASLSCFEPSRETFQRLSERVDGTKGICLRNFGFSDRNETRKLFSDSPESGLASVYDRNLEHAGTEMKETESIELKTLDGYCAESGIKHIDFLKLDVEGHEKKVLDGAHGMIEADAIDFIQFEFGGCNIESRTYFKDFYYSLKGRYRIYRIMKEGLREIKEYKEIYEAFLTTNYLAERKSLAH